MYLAKKALFCSVLQGSGACDGCVNAKDGMYCVAKCPPCKFRDNSGVCQWCHPNCGKVVECSGPPRCTGPGAHLGLGGCIECANLLLDHQEGVGYTECLNRTLVDCEKGFYFFGGKIRIPSNASRGFEDRIVVSVSCLIKPLDSIGNYSATSNNTKLVHWPLMCGP